MRIPRFARPPFFLLRRAPEWTLALAAAIVLHACASRNDPGPAPDSPDPGAFVPELSAPAIASNYDKTTDPYYLVLLAEYRGRQGYIRESLDLYLQVVDQIADVGVIQRGLEVALFVSDYEAALRLSQRWRGLEPDSYQAHLSHLSNLILLDQQAPASVELSALLSDFVLDSERYARLRDRLFSFSGVSIERIGEIAGAVTEPAARNEWWQLLRAEIAIDSGHLGKAAGFADGSIALNSGNEITYHIRARIYFLANDPDQGLSFIKRILSQHPDFYSLYLMEARWQMGSLEEKDDQSKSRAIGRAIECVEYIRQNREKLAYHHRHLYSQATHLLAFIYTSQKDQGDSKPVLQELSQFEAYEEFAYLSLAQLAIQEKDYYLAEDYLRRVRTREYLLSALRLYVEVKIALKKWDEALKSIEYYRLRGQDDESALNAMLMEGEVYIQQHDYQRAFDLYTAGLKRFSDDQSLMLSRSVAAHFLGMVDVIERDMRVILKDSPDNVSALNSLGYSLASLTTRYEEADRLLRRALDLEPDNYAVLDSYGWLLFRQGQHDTARRYLEKAWEGLPDPEIAAHLVELYWVIGMKEKAFQFFQQSEREFPQNRFLEDVRARLGL